MPRLVSSEALTRLIAPLADKLDRTVGWDRLPPKVGRVVLLGLRHRLRERNLYDTCENHAGSGDHAPESPPAAAPVSTAAATPPHAKPSAVREIDGSGNDPTDPRMGASGTRFGRNTPPMLDDETMRGRPDPWDVSRELLWRKDGEFFAAEHLNLLAAAWLQFEVHDWFIHRTDRHDPEYLKRVGNTPNDQRREPPPLKRDAGNGRAAAFISDQTHWWDASQLYGPSEEVVTALREGDGRVKTGRALLEAMEEFMDSARGTSAVPNLWVGTALFHMLFAKEHNAICDLLQREDPKLTGDLLFGKARLINAAVMAKIHTVEWTPAIIAHPATAEGARMLWSGVLANDRQRRFGLRSTDEVLGGVPGSALCHDGAPYALTEEFVAVYRMHQLIPDRVTFRRTADGAQTGIWAFEDLAVATGARERPRQRLLEVDPGDVYYSLGTSPPGEITLHNYPRFLREFRSVDGATMDLGAIDIFRTRETGVPRYNNFRRLFRLEPASSFHDIANGNPKWAREIRDVYEGKLENVDLLIGMFAERKPKGFAFSDTAFRVFLLMATRRLRSDRFFTTDYTPEVYTRAGLEWIEGRTLARALQHHYPELTDVLENVDNPFRRWPEVKSSR
jgi:hypothetical protein